MNRRNLGELLGSITLADIVNPRMAGFALTRAWAYIMFFSTVIHYSTRNDLTHLNSTVTWAALGASCIMVAAALFARPFYTRFLTRRWLPAALAILLLSLMVLLVLIDIINEEWFQQPWCSMFCFTAGVGLGILYLGWGGTYADSNEAKVAVEVTASFLLAALLFAASWPFRAPSALQHHGHPRTGHSPALPHTALGSGSLCWRPCGSAKAASWPEPSLRRASSGLRKAASRNYSST